ncbi:uncharacterized protein LACBIDRAFT_325536 [Laccaria bicolor S238N-H82]|uniref:Predicted protein n=1 Tax=Laccaria bicolor (strain S238N-H82 / ATCC MYA-4686) TaxID=486041 RepID=B0D5F0_LACBS|nr:uncharacterized protein LACBIDRAFT_325536 [Laccaria bicolor S238N-H82]EDR09759.1 predicted protein [Laccaria bicolor S238N-H82]|eukprot:XP_001879144.1 predicted protein [Laccaria bicolor S238N-H82]
MFKTWDHIGQFINTGLLALIGPSAGTINYGLFVLSGLSVLVFPAIKGRSLPEGMGSLGTKALHMRAKIDNLESDCVKARLDSGADITLISEEFWKSMVNSPRLREGMRMKLYHLTGGAKVLGYIKTELFVVAQDESIVSFELEAYVVRNMNVPLLLGEDFQTTYELSVIRHATGLCEVLVGKSGRVLPAASAHNVDLGFEIRVAHTTQSFIRRKAVTRAKPKGSVKKLTEVTASEDTLIQPYHVRNVAVNAAFEGREDWIIEKIIIGTDDQNVMAAPTTWISASCPYLPITNTGPHPRLVRVGEVTNPKMKIISLK